MRAIVLLLIILLHFPADARASDDRCTHWFRVAGEIMEMRQREVPLEKALEQVAEHPLHDRYLVRKLIERAYELPLRFTENAKQDLIELYASTARSACLPK